MQAPVPGRTHVIKFFEGMCKMLPAVISGRKGNIRNVKSAVAQKKGGLLHTLAVDIVLMVQPFFSVKSAWR